MFQGEDSSCVSGNEEVKSVTIVRGDGIHVKPVGEDFFEVCQGTLLGFGNASDTYFSASKHYTKLARDNARMVACSLVHLKGHANVLDPGRNS